MKKTIWILLLGMFANVMMADVHFSREQALRVIQAARMMVPGSEIFTVSNTGSMKPMLDENSLLVITKEPFDQLSIGDVIVYNHPGLKKPVVHRIIEKRGTKLWTKGDNNNRMDNAYATIDNYVGKVCTVVYYRGESVETVRTAAAANR